MNEQPPGSPTPLGGGGPSGWDRARSRCTVCGSVGLLAEGFLEDTGESAKGYVRWVEGARDTGFLGGFSSMGRPRLLVRAFRCRECNHLELFAEPGA
ncbi:hypothetical protein [Ornithinimicrobium cerasi]|uniref:Uncharacterized protein n=1 Tax=Ornithinimicrobium cerasi TaxID=2248773 RepID=A0A285VK69_9MICO|nr:hypothetical protein [Ornithinimicrobium cerasi]SOC54472.1 hypothetical protein SAMN05421879_103155 [Ornithinimicrobium cerasi]